MNINIRITSDIYTAITVTPKTNKTQKSILDLYISFTTFYKGKSQKPQLVSAGLKVSKPEYKKGKIKAQRHGISFTDDMIKERLSQYISHGKAMLEDIAHKKPKAIGEVLNEIKYNSRQRVIGKASSASKKDFVSKIQEHSYESIMNALIHKRNISEGRQRGYQRSFQLLKQFYSGNIPSVDVINCDDLESFNDWLSAYEYKPNKQYANDSLTDYKSKIAAVLKFAIKPMRIITSNPLPECFRGQWVEDSKQEVLTESEILSLMNLERKPLSRTHRVALLCGLSQVFTSLSYCDIINLNKNNFKEYVKLDTDMHNIIKYYIQGERKKTKETFTIFTPSETKIYIDKLIELVGTEDKQLALPTLDYMNRMYRELMTLAGINKHITSKSFRHTFATDYMEKDGSYDNLSIIMGHKNKAHKITKVYGKITLKRQSEAMELYISKCRILHQPHQPTKNYQTMLKAV